MPHMYMLEHLSGGFELRIEHNYCDLFVDKDTGHLHTRKGVLSSYESAVR